MVAFLCDGMETCPGWTEHLTQSQLGLGPSFLATLNRQAVRMGGHMDVMGPLWIFLTHFLHYSSKTILHQPVFFYFFLHFEQLYYYWETRISFVLKTVAENLLLFWLLQSTDPGDGINPWRLNKHLFKCFTWMLTLCIFKVCLPSLSHPVNTISVLHLLHSVPPIHLEGWKSFKILPPLFIFAMLHFPLFAQKSRGGANFCTFVRLDDRLNCNLKL